MTIVTKFINKQLDEAKQELLQRFNVASVQLIQEGQFDRVRSEFSANLSLSKPVTVAKPALDKDKKYRLKDAKTGATRGIYSSRLAADDAHAKHPERKSLMVEAVDQLNESEVIPVVEYYAKGSVGGKPFAVATNDEYTEDMVKNQNPHLDANHIKALIKHIMSDEFDNGDEHTSFNDGIRVSTHRNGGTYGDLDDSRKMIKSITEGIITVPNIPKSTIPAATRKERGEKPLDLKDLEDEKNSSPTTKEGMKNLQKNTGVAK